MICDAHHHYWELNGSTYAVDDLRGDIDSGRHDVTAAVYVECGSWYRTSGPEHLRPVGETEWVAAHADDLTVAIVSHADLCLGDAVTEVLEAHVAAGAGRFRGIRHMATWHESPLIRPVNPFPGPHMLVDPSFQVGFAALARMGLSFDAWVYFTQLPDVVELARAFPDANIILNHLGGPIAMGPYDGHRSDMLETWRSLIPTVASCPNVSIKIGGIGMPIYGLGWHKQPVPPTAHEVAYTWRDPVKFCIDSFGPDRCMLESNFPVDKFSMSYATLWDAFDLITADLGDAERSSLYYSTAQSVYRF